VLVAMTVLAVGIVGVLGAISACVRASTAAAGYSRGTLLAQQVVAELARNPTLEAEALSGTFDDVAPGYRWDAEVAAADAQGLHPVAITVTWENGRRQFTLATTLRPHALPPPPTPEDGMGAGGTGAGATADGASGPAGAADATGQGGGR
jgi:Tfp pilus assembly protein PilV